MVTFDPGFLTSETQIVVSKRRRREQAGRGVAGYRRAFQSPLGSEKLTDDQKTVFNSTQSGR